MAKKTYLRAKQMYYWRRASIRRGILISWRALTYLKNTSFHWNNSRGKEKVGISNRNNI